MIVMIYACDLQNAIGKNGDLPWRQSTDLQHFKRITTGGTIVMGRKTWDSLPGKLPNRKHLVMTRNSRTDIDTVTFEEVLELSNEEDIFIIGGGEIYSLFLPYAGRIHRTIIHCNVTEPDTFAPAIDENEFSVIQSNFVKKAEKDQYDMTFELLEKQH